MRLKNHPLSLPSSKPGRKKLSLKPPPRRTARLTRTSPLTLNARSGPQSFTNIKLQPRAHIYIMGICGTAMSSLAGLLKQKGYQVFGSDHSCYPPTSTLLKKLKIPILPFAQPPRLNPPPSLTIVGNVMSKTHPAVQTLLKSGRPYLHLPEALKQLIIPPRAHTIMITGTHGKTTVSALCAHTLKQCGLNPGFMIGGEAENFKTNFRLGGPHYFVLEGDEYDTAFFEKTPKFLHYPASHIILTNAEFDHADIYKNPEEVKKVFLKLVRTRKTSAQFIIGRQDPPLPPARQNNPSRQKSKPQPSPMWMQQLIQTAGPRAISYGLKQGHYQITTRQNIFKNGQFTAQNLQVRAPNNKTAALHIPLGGEHNALNFTAVWAFTRLLKLDSKKVLKAFKSFKGVKRRTQTLGQFGGVTLIEDFAHHPTAVRAMLKTVREMHPKSRLLAVFEPGSNTSRTSLFQTEYQHAFCLASAVFCLQPAPPNFGWHKTCFSAPALAHALKARNIPAWAANTVQKITRQVQKTARKGDVVLVMSNGDFGGIYSMLKKSLASK